MAEPPPPSTSTAANCALPAKTNSENADACQVPKATPNGVTARAIESA
jgi:hypothetical protein